MNDELPIVTTEAIERCIGLLKDCYAARGIGVITGPNGTGKSTALKTLMRRYPTLGLRGRPFYLRCCPVKGHTRGLKDLVDALGRKIFHGSGASVAYTAKLCLHELKRLEISALFLDDADLWGTDVMEGVVALRDMAIDADYPLVLLMAGAGNPERWIGSIPSAKSRLLKVETIGELTLEQMLGVLRSWGEVFEVFVLSAESGDKEATKAARKLHSYLRGNFRKLGFLASLHQMGGPETRFDGERIEALLPRLAAP